MNRRQKIIVSVTGIFIVLLALIGLTYAYFVTKVTGNTNDKSITVTTANLELEYGGDNGNAQRFCVRVQFFHFFVGIFCTKIRKKRFTF